MNEWAIVTAVIVTAIIFLIYQANKEPSFNPAPIITPVLQDLNYE